MFVALLQCYIVHPGFADQWVSQPIILQRNTDQILIQNETTCLNPVQPDDQTTYLQAPAPVVLGPQYCPKYRVSINQNPHHLSCLCSPTLALPQPSYASGCLAESGPGKVHWVVQSWVHNMIKLKSQTMHIIKLINEYGDFVIILLSCKYDCVWWNRW